MAKTGERDGLKFLGVIRRDRASLLGATALQTAFLVVLALPATAQPAPNARPMGGQVVGGAAQISRTATATDINQSTARAAINWTSFNVGSNQSVNFQQPSTSSVTLNRVTSPDPSAIAGTIHANGQIVLTNSSGVVFYAGSQVDAQSVVVSAPGITTANFMAGRMVFDQAPNPNARVTNAGRITVKQAGLAALVAPQVANSGTITATMGHVVLAGAMAHTVDLYGDGLMSIDVTRQVVQAPLGADGKPVTALVTNTGVIAANGGTVQLTAAAADGIVQNLVDAGGRISANTVGQQAGRIEIAGTGGSVIVTGRLSAQGKADGTAGGQIVVNASDAVTIADGARVNASGRAGGGTIAVGTTLARATQGSALGYANAASSVTVATGARIAANATRSGNGGAVTVLSTNNTTMAGRLSARGGRTGGNGGAIEISGETGFHLTGAVDTGAPRGQPGSILLDPANLTITDSVPGSVTPGTGDPTIAANQGGTTTDATVTPAELEALTGSVHLLTTNNLIVASSLTLTGPQQTLVLEAGNNITINAGVTVSTQSDVTLTAGSVNVPGASQIAGITILGNLITANGTLNLNSTGAGVLLAGNVTAANTVVTTGGPLSQTGGVLTTGSLSFTASSVSLPEANLITAVQSVGNETTIPNATTTGGVLITEAPGQNLAINGNVVVPNGQTIALNADTLQISGAGFLSAPGGTVALAPATAGRPIEIVEDEAATAGRLSLSTGMLSQINTATLQVGSPTSGPIFVGLPGDFLFIDGATTLNLVSGNAVTEGGTLVVPTVAGNAASITLDSANNQFTALGDVTTTNGLTIVNNGALNVAGTITDATSIAIQTQGTLSLAGSLTAPSISLTATPANIETAILLATTGTITQVGGSVNGSTSVFLSATGGIDQTGGVITGGTLSGISGGTTTLTSAGNAITTLGSFSSTGGFALTDTGALTATGPVTDTASITLTAGALALTGTLNAPAVDLVATGAITQPSGSITATTLTGSAGTADLSQGANAIGTLGSFTTSGDFTLADGAPLTVSQTVSTGTGATLTLTDDTTQLATGGSLHAPAGTVVLQPLTLNHSVSLTGPAVAAGPQPIFAQTLVLGSATAGPLVLGGALDLSNVSVLELLTADAATQSAGATLIVGALTGQVGSAGLTGANQIGTLGPFQSTGDFALTDGIALTVTGPVTAGNVQFTDQAGVQFAGNVATGALILDGGAFTQSAGVLSATTLSGTATSAVLGGQNAIATLGNFTTSGDFALTDATDLAVAGAVTAANVTLIGSGSVQFTGDVSTGTLALSTGNFMQNTGTLTATTLTGNAASALLDGTNAIANVTGFTTSGNFALLDTITLVQSGPLNSANVILIDAQTVQFTGNVNTGTLALSIGTITQTAGTLTVATLTGNAGSATFDGANAIATLGNFLSSGDFTLNNNAALVVAGSVQAADVTLTGSGSVQFTGNVNTGTGTLTLDTGAVTQGTGTITVSTLTGNAASAVLNGTNAIITLGSFTTAGDFALTDTAALGQTGTLSGANVSLTDAAGVRLAGSITAGTLALNGGTFTQIAGTLTAAMLTGNAVSVTLGQPNAISAIGSFTTTGGFELSDATALAVTGPLTDAVSIGLNVTGDLSLAGAITAPLVNVTATGAITQTGGAITATTLTGDAASATLGSTANLVTNLGDFTTTTAFLLTDATSLTTTGAVEPPHLTLPDLTLNVTGNLTIASALEAGTASLTATGAITEATGGSLFATTLTGGAASATFDSAITVANLGNFATTNGFVLIDNSPLSVAGTLTDGSSIAIQTQGPLALSGVLTAPAISLTATPANLDVTAPPPATGTITQTAGSVNGSASVFLSATGAIDQTGGTITGGTLSGTSGGTTTLTSAGNAIAGLGSFTSTGGFALTDGEALTATGPVTDTASIALNIAGPLTLAGTLNAPAIDLIATGAITQPSGGITATTLTGSAGSATLDQAANAIGTLGSFASTGDFSLVDGGPLIVNGPVSVADGGTLTLQTTALTLAAGGTLSAPGGTVDLPFAGSGTFAGVGVAGAITANLLILGSAGGGSFTIAGQFDLADVGVLELLSGGAVSETGAGSLTVGALTGSTATSVLNGTNAIGTLGSFTTTGDFALTDGIALTVNGPVRAANVTLADAAGIQFAGNVSTGTLTLNGGAFTQSAGVLTATTLTGSGSSAAFGGPNAVATLGNFTTNGDFALTDGTALAVNGPVQASNVTLADTAGIQFAGNVSTGTLALTGGALTQSAGTLTATTLTGSGSSAAFGGPNAVATLGSFTTNGDFALTDGTALVVNGPVQAANVMLADAAGIQFAGNVRTGTLTLTGGALTQSAGTLTATTLTGSGSSAAFGGPNAVATVGNFTTNGDFALTDGTALVVNGPVQAANVTLADAAGIQFAGNVRTGTLILTGGALTQSAGTLTATTLTGSGSSAAFGGPNAVATLGSFTTTGNFALNDRVGLAVAGPVNSANLSLTDAGAVQFAGTVSTGTLTVTAGGTVTQNAGILTAATLTGSAAGLAQFGAAGPAPVARIGTLATFLVAGGNFQLADSQPLTIQGTLSANTVAISAPGQVTLAGGTIATAGQSIAGQPGSAIVATAGNDGAGVLTQTGTESVTGATLRLQAPGGIALNNLVAPSTGLVLASDGAITGAIDVGSLNVQGQNGLANLTGFVDGIGGNQAAIISTIAPAINANYLLNDCVIMAATCGGQTTHVVPPPVIVLPPFPTALPSLVASPLQEEVQQVRLLPSLSLPLTIAVTHDPDDPDLQLPNISDRDY